MVHGWLASSGNELLTRAGLDHNGLFHDHGQLVRVVARRVGPRLHLGHLSYNVRERCLIDQVALVQQEFDRRTERKAHA
jgi:hypothetical protein